MDVEGAGGGNDDTVAGAPDAMPMQTVNGRQKPDFHGWRAGSFGGGERVEKLLVQSKFAGEYERPMQEESGDEVRFMRDSELEEARKRPLVTRSHPVPTDEELRESFERNYVHENRDGSRRLLAAARVSDHVYPTGSMTRRWPDGTFDKVDLTAEPYLIYEVAREVDGRIVPLSAEAEDGDVRFMMGDGAGTFKVRQKRAVAEKGVVMPGLNKAEVKVVDVPKHTYTGNIAEATRQAIDAAKAKYAPNGKTRTLNYNNHGTKFDYSISGHAIGIVLSPKHQGKSFNKGVHLAMAEHLDDVIGQSIEVEEHPDYIKNEHDERDTSLINDKALMHRFYGAVVVDGVPYRVMTLMREERNPIVGNGIHAYEVPKIEVLDEETPNTPNGVGSHPQSEIASSYPLTNILKNVEKSYDSGKLLLDESAKEDRKREIQNTQNGSGGGRAAFMMSSESDADYMDPVKKGDAEKAGRMVREAAKRAMPETKVVDENGEPRVMYHGTNLTRVNGSMPFWVFNEDSHFGTREQAEDDFGRSLRRKELSKIYSVYLDIRNPKSTADESRIPRMPMRRTLLNIW